MTTASAQPRLDDFQGLIDPARVLAVEPIAGGKNNRLFRVDTASRQFVLKEYFQHPGDLRDRRRVEFGFSSFAWSQGLRCVPEPIATSESLQSALYGYVAGQRLVAGEVDWHAADAALSFYEQLNRFKGEAAAQRLPSGSEACFSLHDHFECVDRRIGLLEGATAEEPIERAALDFVRAELRPRWSEVRQAAARAAAAAGIDPAAPIASGSRCLSPSDFGYHNALRCDGGRYTFLDFEYAGWDDPGKLVCDFFCQPRVPVPAAFFDRFAQRVAEGLPESELQVARFRLLLPVYRVKWCCILLNLFSPVGKSRRQFAQGAEAEREGSTQLERAKRLLKETTDAA